MLTLLIIVYTRPYKISALDGLSVYARANTEQDKTTIHNCIHLRPIYNLQTPGWVLTQVILAVMQQS